MDIFSDGGARGNPGPAACAFVVVDNDGKVVHKRSKFLGDATNNRAEYQGVALALNWLLSNEVTKTPINFYMDSELVVKQLNRDYKVKDQNLKNLFFYINNLLLKIKPKIIFQHVPRLKNKLADFLVNKELDGHTT